MADDEMDEEGPLDFRFSPDKVEEGKWAIEDGGNSHVSFVPATSHIPVVATHYSFSD
jgi:hypothetical protein